VRPAQPTNFDPVREVLDRIQESREDRLLKDMLDTALNTALDTNAALDAAERPLFATRMLHGVRTNIYSEMLAQWLRERGFFVKAIRGGALHDGWAQIQLEDDARYATVHLKYKMDPLLFAYVYDDRTDEGFDLGQDGSTCSKNPWTTPSDLVSKLKELYAKKADQMSALSDEIKGEIGEAKKPRDDISKLPMSASGKRYARLHGMKDLAPGRKFRLYSKMVADEVNGGVIKGFVNRDAAGKVKKTF
jgi:hypothetical protein